MAWIESHQSLATHPKLFKFASLTGYDMDRCIGKLHRLWWWALDYAEDGDLSKFQPETIASGMAIFDMNESKKVVNALVESGFIDQKTSFIHDWLDYAGKYLNSKYHTSNPAKYKRILKKHRGRPKGEPKGSPKAIHLPLPTNLNQPTYQPKDSRARFEIFWGAYPKKKSKGRAEKAFFKIDPDEQLLAKMLSSIERARTSRDWLKEKGRFIPHPATWLNDKGWEDEFGGGNGKGRKGFDLPSAYPIDISDGHDDE
jgi:hypothetical protein